METNDTKKLDVVIQQTPMYEDEGMSLADIWRALKRNRMKLIAWLLLGALVGGIAGAGYAFFTRPRDIVTTIVQFSFDGVEQGLDPKGAVFDVNKLKSPQIVDPALVGLGYTASADVNAETVRQAMSIEGQVPQDVIDRLTVITTIATNTSSVANLEKVLDVSYYPTQFKVNLDAGELNLSTDKARALLDAVVASYRTYFFETYADVQVLGTAIDSTDYSTYDYSEAVDVLSAQFSTMLSYVNGYERLSPNFRSTDTGFTFADIRASLQILRSVDLSLVDSLVYSYNLTRDKDLMLMYLDYQKEEKARELTVAQRTQSSINEKLDAYEKDTVMMMGTDGQDAAQTGMTMTLKSTEYDSLMRQSIASATEVAQLNAEIDKLQSRYDRVIGQGIVTNTEYKKRCEEADERLAALSAKINDWVDLIRRTADEYYNAEVFKDAYRVLIPAQEANAEMLSSLVKYGLIGFVGGMGAVLLIYLIGTCFGLAADDGQRRKQQSVSAQA